MPYDTIEVASTNKTIFNLKNLFIPTAQAVGVHYSDHHIRVTFKSLNVYYVSIEDGDKTIENNGKIYASSENFSDFSVIKTNEYLKQLDKSNNLDNFEMYSYLSKLDNLDGYVICGLNSKGQQKLENNELTELKINEKINGKNVVSIEGFFDNIDFSSVKKIIIPSSVKIIQPYAFRAFSPDTEFVHEGGYDFVGEGAFPTAK